MRVKWIDRMSARDFENVRGMYPEQADPSDFDKDMEGEVLGTTRDFWGTTYLVVMTDEGKVREVKASIVTIKTSSK